MGHQLGVVIVRVVASALVLYLGRGIVRVADASDKRRRDAEYSIRLQALAISLAGLEDEKRAGKANGK